MRGSDRTLLGLLAALSLVAAACSNTATTSTAPSAAASAAASTTLCVVALSVPVDRIALAQVARASTAALSRRITPSGTSVDGDVVFALCPDDIPAAPDSAFLLRAEVLATAALEQAIERAVRYAVGREGVPGLSD